MNKKLFYTQPTTDLLELRSEGLVCTSDPALTVQIEFGDRDGYGDVDEF